MKILVLNGSPKGERSNSLKLTKAFLKGIAVQTETEVDMVDVGKLNLHECRGCFACWNKTPGKCVTEDDMSKIIEKLCRADVVIWSFPLYHFSLPARLKMLIDRQLPMYQPFMESDAAFGGHGNRYDMTGKRYVVISTCGFYTAEGNYTAVDAQFDKMYGEDGYTSIYCGQGELFRVPELKTQTDQYLLTVMAAGEEFARGAVTEETKAKLSRLLFPREVFEQMADASWGVTKESGEEKTADDSLIFTKQMAALYNKASWKGADIILEFVYTDVGKTYQVILGKEGNTVLTENFLPYTTKIETPFSVWQRIANGEISGEQALMERLYKVTGDFNVMMKWEEYFGWGNEAAEKSVGAHMDKRQTNMMVMLLPWMVMWVAIAIDSFRGGIACIAVCGALPFAFLKYRPTIYEYCSLFAGSIVGLFSILGYPVTILIPLSYLLFGILWTVTVFLRVPLTSWYSMNSYGGEKAFDNPLFMQTNRILTACWGVLYLLTPIWTYFLLKTPVSEFTGLINSVLPLLMGIFTAWFQKWYPRHYASRGI